MTWARIALERYLRRACRSVARASVCASRPPLRGTKRAEFHGTAPLPRLGVRTPPSAPNPQVTALREWVDWRHYVGKLGETRFAAGFPPASRVSATPQRRSCWRPASTQADPVDAAALAPGHDRPTCTATSLRKSSARRPIGWATSSTPSTPALLSALLYAGCRRPRRDVRARPLPADMQRARQRTRKIPNRRFGGLCV